MPKLSIKKKELLSGMLSKMLEIRFFEEKKESDFTVFASVHRR